MQGQAEIAQVVPFLPSVTKQALTNSQVTYKRSEQSTISYFRSALLHTRGESLGPQHLAHCLGPEIRLQVSACGKWLTGGGGAVI